MSRAFVKEIDDGPESLPERPVSSAPNLVTARGLEMISEEMAALEAELAGEVEADHAARLRRDLRYWSLRHATARLTAPDPDEPGAQFGSRVGYRAEGEEPRTVTIVGEDEADPNSGTIAYTAPIAQALMGAVPGAVVTVTLRGEPVDIEVVSVETPEDGAA
jgi:transcription elongation GreA/GreB family factor